MLSITKIKLFAATLAFSVISIGLPLQAMAAGPVQTPAARVSFTFDDGLLSSLNQAAPTLSKYGFTGTNYVTTGCIGMTTVPNTCGADEDEVYMTWAQVTQLKNMGWEIGSHTVTHPLLASSDPDFQPQKLTASQVTQELTNSKNTLASNGINATAFASPYGDYNQAVLAQIAKLYSSHRGFADTGYNAFPYNDYIIRDQQVQAGVPVSAVKSYIDQAIASKTWLVLTFHDIQTNASTDPDDYEYKTADLDQIAAYVKSKNIPVVNVSDGQAGGTNLLPNSTFDSGVAGGWTTDAPANVLKNTAGNGNSPSATNSISMTGTTKNIHLFSPQVNVSAGSTYFLKSYLNLSRISSGSVGYYIDEYNGAGNWISGQSKYNTSFAWPQIIGFEYKPSSASVIKARVQVIVTVNSRALAYIDNFQWVNEGVSTPPPAQTNLMPNSTFDNGIADGWRTNSPATMVKDTASNGSPANPINSIKMGSTAANTHLFSPLITVDSTKSYSLANYLKITQRTAGEIGFYIDEYDVNGNWISGQWKTGIVTISAGDVSFTYTPSSASVKKASLQVIVTANSGITAFVDHIRWYQN